MAIPPTIPTSFLPHPTSEGRRFHADFTGAFGFFAYAVLGIVFLLAVAVFLYGRLLASNKAAKDAALARAESAIDPTTVETFVRLRDRLAFGETLLERHIALTPFFSLLERLLPAAVRFTTLGISVNDAGVPKIEGSGVARSFNALAATSNALAADGRVKDAIFSNISVNRNGTVSFSLSAALEPKFSVFTPVGASEPTAAASP